MASVKGEKSTSKIVSLLVVIFMGAIFWFAGDLFLPMYRWFKIDWEDIAQKTGVPVDQLQVEREYHIRYAPRKGVKDDPYPFQIIHKSPKKTPQWVYDLRQKHDDYEPDKDWYEKNVLIRCQVLSDRTGSELRSPLEINVGSTYQDRYFKVKAFRLPPGAIDETAKGRCTLLVDIFSLDKMSIDEAIQYHHQIPRWLKDPENGWIDDSVNINDFPERYDGHGPQPD